MGIILSATAAQTELGVVETAAQAVCSVEETATQTDNSKTMH